MTFSYENWDQIVQLVLEIIQSLSTAAGGKKAAKEVCENFYAFMTDAATNNFKVEAEVLKQPNTKHIPIYLLCKSHTCQKLNESCTNTFVNVDQNLKISEILSQRQTSLRSFIRQSNSIVLCAMTTLLKFVPHEECANSTSRTHIILEESNVTKLFSFYKEKRFAKLGYTAGLIADCASV